VADHGSMVWDEIIAIWAVLLFVLPQMRARKPGHF
jgi:phosphatidylglycerophosphatase A